MLNADDNELLCRVEGEAPMGRLMRAHWIPGCLAEEVAERDGSPVRIRLLGEELVAFRDSAGRLGVLDEHCPHRRASLALGRNEECGLRCLYHGWKIDVEGNIVDRPSEPATAGADRRGKHRTYPCRESGGFVWVWMGDPESPAPFRPPAWAPSGDIRTSVVKMHINCNWAQVLEGAIDSAHSSSLHATDMVPVSLDDGSAQQEWRRPSVDKAPRLHVERTSWGFRYVAIRHPLENADTHDYLRITLFVAPFTVLIPPNPRYSLSILNIPQDDTHTMFYFIAWSEGAGIPQDEWRKFCGAQVSIDLDHQFRSIRTKDNDYLQNRASMRGTLAAAGSSQTGIVGIPNQDMAMWETMGQIADRSKERLGVSDVAIVHFRRIMVEAARAMQGGGQAIGTGPGAIPHVALSSFAGIVPKATDWKTLGGETAPSSATDSAGPTQETQQAHAD